LKADSSKLKRRVYNLAGISFNPEQLAAAIQKYENMTKLIFDIG
jgi:hypothetical protein